jgi:hypothetical protein
VIYWVRIGLRKKQIKIAGELTSNKISPVAIPLVLHTIAVLDHYDLRTREVAVIGWVLGGASGSYVSPQLGIEDDISVWRSSIKPA